MRPDNAGRGRVHTDYPADCKRGGKRRPFRRARPSLFWAPTRLPGL